MVARLTWIGGEGDRLCELRLSLGAVSAGYLWPGRSGRCLLKGPRRAGRPDVAAPGALYSGSVINATLISGTLTNWTLSDRTLRFPLQEEM